MISNITAWFRSKNITTHAVWIALFGLAVTYDSSSTFRDQVGLLFVGHPVVVTKIGAIASNIVILAGIWAKLSHSSSPAGIVAASRAVLKSPDAPTAEQVDAATPKN
jgi:hypothetical protein